MKLVIEIHNDDDENAFMHWSTSIENLDEVPELLHNAAEQLEKSGGKPAYVKTALGAMPYEVYTSFVEKGVFEE